MRALADILAEYEFLDSDDRYRLLIELGRELDRAHPAEGPPGPGTARIEIADLKDRVRKLEAIAAGVDL